MKKTHSALGECAFAERRADLSISSFRCCRFSPVKSIHLSLPSAFSGKLRGKRQWPAFYAAFSHQEVGVLADIRVQAS
nr:hypothetical protein [Planococcus salinarum]